MKVKEKTSLQMAGYSATPLAQKLGLAAQSSMLVVNAPQRYGDLLVLPPEVRVVEKFARDLDFVHLFVRSRKELSTQFPRAKRVIAKDGMLWVSWPKRSSGVQSDLSENVVREIGLKNGLVDVKICALDETWSALKFVYRLKNRR